ncbi:MAG: hypothetical protein ACLTYN_03195 [Dysosmobacter welbionis]
MAHAVAFLASDKASFLTGQSSPPTAGSSFEDAEQESRAPHGGARLCYVRPGSGSAWRITRPKQASVRPLPAVSTTSASARARFRRKDTPFRRDPCNTACRRYPRPRRRSHVPGLQGIAIHIDHGAVRDVGDHGVPLDTHGKLCGLRAHRL